jgi:hypothetical protein
MASSSRFTGAQPGDGSTPWVVFCRSPWDCVVPREAEGDAVVFGGGGDGGGALCRELCMAHTHWSPPLPVRSQPASANTGTPPLVWEASMSGKAWATKSVDKLRNATQTAPLRSGSVCPRPPGSCLHYTTFILSKATNNECNQVNHEDLRKCKNHSSASDIDGYVVVLKAQSWRGW